MALPSCLQGRYQSLWAVVALAGILAMDGCATFQIDGWDRKVSNWARGHTPIFGSTQNAVDWSDRLRAISGYAYYASALITPSGDDPAEWFLDKLRGVAVGEAAILATRGALDLGLNALTYGTAWARVESGFHYPSDTLVGMSLGNFSGAFFNDAFLGLQPYSRSSLSLAVLSRGAMLRMRLQY
jgi:hypothetical protein